MPSVILPDPTKSCAYRQQLIDQPLIQHGILTNKARRTLTDLLHPIPSTKSIQKKLYHMDTIPGVLMCRHQPITPRRNPSNSGPRTHLPKTILPTLAGLSSYCTKVATSHLPRPRPTYLPTVNGNITSTQHLKFSACVACYQGTHHGLIGLLYSAQRPA